ncbi:MAG: hypothetical protein L0Y78_10325 [candidate division NC10 bacterium]|nr:hypothetical protein [candidate division NC10 bacterium]
MPPCRIDIDASPTFQKLLRKLQRTCRKINEDLTEAFESIEKDYTKAAQANAIPKYANTVWKYRCKSSDLRRGAQGGFRIIAYYHQSNGTLYPILIYLKTEKEDVSAEEIQKAIQALKDILSRPEEPPAEA